MGYQDQPVMAIKRSITTQNSYVEDVTPDGCPAFEVVTTSSQCEEG